MGKPLRGVNIAGAEVAYDHAVVPKEGEHYIWASLRDIDYLASKGVGFARITFSWELAQPELNGDLSVDDYFGVLLDRVSYATSKGMTVMIEPHGGTYPNFARYKGGAVGSQAVPASSFADFWGKVETTLNGNADVMLGLSNEPNDISTVQWFSAAKDAVDAIHMVNPARQIFVSGNGFSQPSSWRESWYDTADPQISNASAWEMYLPDGNVIASVHTYFDTDGGGFGDDVVNPDIIEQRLEPAVAWARASGVSLHLTEFGANQATPGASQAVAKALAYIDANADVIAGWSWWTYGAPSWWSDYHFTLCPIQNYTVDNPKLAWLQSHFVAPAPTPVIRPRPTTETAPPDDRNPFIARAKVVPGQYPGVKDGNYTIRARIRTTYSDDETFCVAVILENPNDGVEIDWPELTIDLRGHTLVDWWDADLVGTTGWVSAKSSDQTRTIGSHNKMSFGLCLKRDDAPLRSNEQLRIKDLQW